MAREGGIGSVIRGGGEEGKGDVIYLSRVGGEGGETLVASAGEGKGKR